MKRWQRFQDTFDVVGKEQPGTLYRSRLSRRKPGPGPRIACSPSSESDAERLLIVSSLVSASLASESPWAAAHTSSTPAPASPDCARSCALTTRPSAHTSSPAKTPVRAHTSSVQSAPHAHTCTTRRLQRVHRALRRAPRVDLGLQRLRRCAACARSTQDAERDQDARSSRPTARIFSPTAATSSRPRTSSTGTCSRDHTAGGVLTAHGRRNWSLMKQGLPGGCLCSVTVVCSLTPPHRRPDVAAVPLQSTRSSAHSRARHSRHYRTSPQGRRSASTPRSSQPVRRGPVRTDTRTDMRAHAPSGRSRHQHRTRTGSALAPLPENLVDVAWGGARPARPAEPIVPLGVKFAGAPPPPRMRDRNAG
jgi:hypothetical protein